MLCVALPHAQGARVERRRKTAGGIHMHFCAYLRVGALLHLNTVLYLLLMKPSLNFGLTWLEQGLLVPGILSCWLASFFLTNMVLSQLDARSRWQNYKQIKDYLYGFGYRERIFKPLLKSSCQRQAALIAAEELGYRTRVEAFFWSHGYRWYHIPPDFVFAHPRFLLSRHFWRTTFFAPTYHPKHFPLHRTAGRMGQLPGKG
jgi:hypothetical protein